MTRTVNSIRIRSRNKTVGKKVEESSSLVYYGYLTGIWRERKRSLYIYMYDRTNLFGRYITVFNGYLAREAKGNDLYIYMYDRTNLEGEEGIRVRFNKFVNVSRFSSPW